MPKKMIHVASGENLAALLKAFPGAKVETLIGEPGRDSWRLTIDLEEPALEVPDKPKEAKREVKVFRVKHEGGNRQWWLSDGREVIKQTGTLKLAQAEWERVHGKPKAWVRIKGTCRPSEAAAEIAEDGQA